jgi:hypothetical protein
MVLYMNSPPPPTPISKKPKVQDTNSDLEDCDKIVLFSIRIVLLLFWYYRFFICSPPLPPPFPPYRIKLASIAILLQTPSPPYSDDIISERSLTRFNFNLNKVITSPNEYSTQVFFLVSFISFHILPYIQLMYILLQAMSQFH